jgi:hypothetical protein
MVISALKFRFNTCENRAFTFKGLKNETDKPKPHLAMSAEKLAFVFEALKNNPAIELASHLLYDLAGRCQDLLSFKFCSFVPTKDGGALLDW